MLMQTASISPKAMFASFWVHRNLIVALTKREVIGRYRGSFMGLAWSFLNPVLMLIVYTFVFSVVFRARWGGDGDESKASFAVVLFVGMIVHSLFAECVNRAPGLIVSNASYVKKVVFPLEILPVVAMGATLFHTMVSMFILIVVMLFLKNSVPVTALYFPLIIFPLLPGTLGIAWALASLGTFVRDIAQTTGIITTVMMFLAPVFYSASNLPETFQVWLFLNPLTFIIEQARGVVISGRHPEWSGLAIYSLISFAIAWLGFFWFQKTRKGFADVL